MLSYALPYIETEFCTAIDADTEVEPDGGGLLMRLFSDEMVVASCGFVSPRAPSGNTMWSVSGSRRVEPDDTRGHEPHGVVVRAGHKVRFISDDLAGTPSATGRTTDGR